MSNEFHYGVFSWTLTVKPQTLVTWRQDEPGLHAVLTRRFRAKSQSLLCRLNYTLTAGCGERRAVSERRDETVGTAEETEAWVPRIKLTDAYVRQLRDGGMVRVRIDLAAAHVMTEFVMCVNPGGGGNAQQR